ncbi:MAG: hypothetical protein TREMPRED_000891 [Tremellales sp. Tagirdzhanova-0007]|nr:MAG: hypothetical protein TREMPRED_000891 [Tremellales sp. Tagirdzhanova-0007]
MALSPNKPVIRPNDRWLIPNPKSIWAPERWGWRARSGRELTGHEEAQKRVRRCRKCDGPKPEVRHDTRWDHHLMEMGREHITARSASGINACVGLHNQRHFVLFMAWLSIACWTVVALGYVQFWDSFTSQSSWSGYTPRLAYTLLYVLSIAIGIAVPVLASWHVYMVSKGETSIESHDNAYLDTRARAEGLIYLNPYDLGRRKNINYFFHTGPTGYAAITLLFPLAVSPSSNGWTYPRRLLPTEPTIKPSMKLHAPELAEGLVAENGYAGDRRYVMGDEEGLTDDEEGGGGWMD